MFHKIEVNGAGSLDLYKWLRTNSKLKGGDISWNFGKFLLDRNGEIVNYFEPKISPNSILPWIKGLINNWEREFLGTQFIKKFDDYQKKDN